MRRRPKSLANKIRDRATLAVDNLMIRDDNGLVVESRYFNQVLTKILVAIREVDLSRGKKKK